LLRYARTSALLFISVSVIAFLYFESDIFPKGIPRIDLRITYEQYESYLKQRHRTIEQQLIHAGNFNKEILIDEKSDIEKRLKNLPADYTRYAGWVQSQMSRLGSLQEKVPSKLLKRAREAFATGDLMRADLLIDRIENAAYINDQDAAMLAFMRGSLARWSVNSRQAYQHYARAACP
jgi:hypothetical protein